MLRIVLKALLKVLFRVRVTGEVALPAQQRLLIIANHQSFLDGLLLGLFLPVDPVFVVNTDVARTGPFRIVLALIEHLTIDPENPLAMKKVIRLLEQGRPVMIFPEGRITTTGSLMKVYDGPAFAAAKTGATIIPVGIDGLSGSWFSRTRDSHPHTLFPAIRISIQPATRLSLPETGNAKERRKLAGEALRRIMQAMVFNTQPCQPLHTMLLDTIKLHGRRRRIVEDVQQIEYSYAHVLKMTLALGRLSAKFSGPGENIGILLPNLTSTVCLFLGMNAWGRVPAMLNYTAGTEGMQSACHAARIKTVITSREFVRKAGLTQQLAALKDVRLLYLEDMRSRFSLLDKLWLLLLALPFPRLVMQAGDPEAAAVVLFTSGSEGKPKGVVLSHRALVSNIAQIRSVIDFSPHDKILNAMPVFHAFGLTAGALLPLLTGTRLFLYPSPLHYRVIPEVAYDRACTVLYGTSTFLGNYAKFAHPYDFHRLRYVIAGAEKLSDAVRAVWSEKFGLRILEGYGATETAPVLAVNTPMAYSAGTVGQFLPGIEAQVLPVPGIERGGLLHVRGPNVMSGYYRHERPGVLEPPASEVGMGWYCTGDVVEIDDNGFVRILGRVKRFAKVAGEMVSLEVTEHIANHASPEAQHAATAITDPQRGEAIVLVSTDPQLSREALQRAARELGHADITVPRRILHVASLPLLGTGKIDYVALHTLAEQAP